MSAITSFLTDSRKLVYVLGAGIALLVFVTFIFILSNLGGGGTQGEVKLSVWGVFDDASAFDQAIRDFQKANPGTTVTYRNLPFQEYEQAVLNGLAAGQGPDVWMIHHTWLPKHIDKLQPLPDTVKDSTGKQLMTLRQFRDTFVDVAATDLVNDSKIYAMPLYMDTLGLYYNRDLLSTAGIARPPATWTDFLDAVKKTTKYDVSRNITVSGAALGTYRNINRSTDILMQLMLQSGVRMTSSDNTRATFAQSVDSQPVGERALEFYTDFANPQKEVYTWNDSMDYSIDAFAAGKTAMMLNYAHQVNALRSIAPRLNWGTAAVPQASSIDSRSYANYWALAVSRSTPSSEAAWKLVHYLTAGEGNVPYLNATSRSAARRDLIEFQKSDPDSGIFAEQALTARSWFQQDNQAIEAIFATMIDDVNLGRRTVRDALREAESKVSVLMSR